MDTNQKAPATSGGAEHAHCTFCDLIQGAAEVSICHEDADAIAFMDIQPVNNGHILVVPRAHYDSLLDVPPEIGMHLFQVTMRLANAVRVVTGCDDMNIVVNSGKAAGQDEPHYHVHIIPRREGDGFDIPLPFNGSAMPDRTLLDAWAARIGSALNDPMRAPSSSTSSGEPGRSAKPDAPETADTPEETRHTAPRKKATLREDDTVRADHAVALAVFDESEKKTPSSPPDFGQRKAGTWRVLEGAHGELLQEPFAEPGDAA